MINRDQHLDVSFACGQEFLKCFQQSVFGRSSYEFDQLLKVEILGLMLRLAPKTDSFCKHITEMFIRWCLNVWKPFKFTKYCRFFFYFVTWSGHCFFVCIFTLANSVSLGVLWMHICVLLHVIYINIWIYSVYLTCHLTSWFAIYTGLGTFFFILKRCLQICMFYIDVLFWP